MQNLLILIKIFQIQSLEQIDRNRDIERILNQNAKDAALCCCEAKLEAQKNACDTQRLIIEKTAATDALILAVEGRGNLDKLSEARSKDNSIRNYCSTLS
jgi:hypothetical protein